MVKHRIWAAALLTTMTQVPAQAALDMAAMWNFNEPAQSEARFRAALATAQGDDALILQTQIARSWGLRREFARARELLLQMQRPIPTQMPTQMPTPMQLRIQPQLSGAGSEAQVRYALEWGRTWASATHAPETQDEDARQQARTAFATALTIARQAKLDALAIDAVHMLAFVDTTPADQLKWAQEALALALASTQPAAQRWEASIRNNLGYALHQLGRHAEALAEFEQAVLLRQQAPEGSEKAARIRVARWMVAWTLRSLQRESEALALQLQLEADNDAAGAPDAYVFEELETLYRSQGDEARALHYAQRRAALPK